VPTATFRVLFVFGARGSPLKRCGLSRWLASLAGNITPSVIAEVWNIPSLPVRLHSEAVRSTIESAENPKGNFDWKGEEKTMALFLSLYKFTDQGIRDVKDSPKRLDAAIKAAEAMGIKVLGAYYTLGEYDLVVVSEVTKEEAAVAHTLATNSLGNVRSLTMRAFTPAEFEEILKKIA
jgi:uncharacterized protein with GYD domain